jgi:hypothetical protein
MKAIDTMEETINGDDATVTPSDHSVELKFSRVQGKWKVAYKQFFGKVTDTATQTHQLDQEAEIMNGLTAEVNDNQFKTVKEVVQALQQRLGSGETGGTTRPSTRPASTQP